MLFNDGKYKHENGTVVLVKDGVVMLSPNHPLSMRLSEIFDSSKWEKIN